MVQFHLKNFDFKTDSWSTQGYICLLCWLAFYWNTCGSPVIKCLCFFVIFFFSFATKWKNCAIVPSGHWAFNTMTTNCDPMRCSHADHACYLDDDWRCHAQTGPGHMTNTRFLLIKLFCRSFCISTCLDYDHLKHYSANARNTYRRIHKSYCSWPIHTKRCYWAVRMKAMKALYALYAKYVNFLVEKRTLVEKSKIINMKPNCIYSMQPI